MGSEGREELGGNIDDKAIQQLEAHDTLPEEGFETAEVEEKRN